MQFTRLPESRHPLVLIRALGRDDVPAWYGYLSMPVVFEHTSWNVRAAEDLLPYVEADDAAEPSSPVRFAIAANGTGELVGTAGFHTVSALNRRAEIAYDLAPAHWGKGIAASICAALVRWAFEHVGLVRVQASVLESNFRSAKVLERCGFEREGLLRNYRMVRGKPGNFWMYSTLGGAKTPIP